MLPDVSIQSGSSSQQEALLSNKKDIQHGRRGLDERRPPQLPKWKKSVRYCGLAAGIVFLLNLAFLIVFEGLHGFKPFKKNDGRRVLYESSCDSISRANMSVHFIINVLSTVLLGASNYCMQCLSAPTRAEVDQAHARYSWVYIGVSSIRNLSRVRKRRVFLWTVLCLSSLPLHLFYNSIIFETVTALDYTVFSANEAFIHQSSENFTYIGDGFFPENKIIADFLFNLAHDGRLERLNNSECIDQYAKNFQGTFGNLLLVVSDSTENYTSNATVEFETGYSFGGFDWICTQTSISCTKDKAKNLRKDSKHWSPFNKPVLYCMAEKTDEKCHLQYSVHLVLLVIFMGLIKVASMLHIALTDDDIPLLTVGDAIASFLDEPDARVRGICLLDKNLTGYRSRDLSLHHNTDSGSHVTPPKLYRPKNVRSFSAASKLRRVTFSIIVAVVISGTIASIGGVIYLSKFVTPFGYSSPGVFTSGLEIGTSNNFNMPFPSVSEGAADGMSLLLGTILLCNLPQVALSFAYLNYNGLMTAMSLAREWASYGNQRKGLRVSTNPKGAQRSEYRLQLPYRYGFPIMVTTGVLHWLISQSFFFVSVQNIYSCAGCSGNIWKPADPLDIVMQGAVSQAGILGLLIVSNVLIVWISVVGFRKLPSQMPLVSSCSAAIAAACHVLPGEIGQDTAEAEVMWGAMGDDCAEIGHCGFSMYGVRQPEEGKLYA